MLNHDDLRIYLRQVRKSKSYSLARVAETIGITVEALSNFERGKSRIKLENMMLLLDVYGLSASILDNFYTRSENMQSVMDHYNSAS